MACHGETLNPAVPQNKASLKGRALGIWWLLTEEYTDDPKVRGCWSEGCANGTTQLEGKKDKLRCPHDSHF